MKKECEMKRATTTRSHQQHDTGEMARWRDRDGEMARWPDGDGERIAMREKRVGCQFREDEIK
jgi:hypothetical protein